MPCDIGYKSYQETYLPAPQPQPKKFAKKVEAPKIDQDLLDKVGETDPEFVEWFKELDADKLLGFILEETLKSNSVKGLKFSVDNGFVVVDGEYSSEAEKRRLNNATSEFMNEFQMRTIEMIAKLLGFETALRKKDGKLIIEGEKANTDNNQVTRYLKISRDASGKSEIMFEHYSNPKALKEEQGKFSLLSEIFRVPINFTEVKRTSGSPIPAGEVHNGHLKEV